MTNHPNRRPRPTGPDPATLRSLRAQAGLTQAAAAGLVHATQRTWQDWESGARAMPAAAIELWCISAVVGTLDSGPYIAPGDWMRPWVRYELLLWFRRMPAPLAA